MENARNCKGCQSSIKVTNKQISEMLYEMETNKLFTLTDDITYKYRLSQCENCKYLQYETTCIQCGCIVQIRARLLDSYCPHPNEQKW